MLLLHSADPDKRLRAHLDLAKSAIGSNPELARVHFHAAREIAPDHPDVKAGLRQIGEEPERPSLWERWTGRSE